MDEPTAEQCSNHAPIELPDGRTGYAIWYPQMGGYVGRAIVAADGDCFDAWVWHDGDFPFAPGNSWRDASSPRELHHCEPRQFVAFGQTVERLLDSDG